MKCTYFQHLVTLKYSGFINHDQEVLLQDHLKNCPACASQEIEFSESELLLESLRGKQPELDYKEELSRSVLFTIQKEQEKQIRSKYSISFNSLLYQFDLIYMKYAFAAIVLVLFVFFGVQQYFITKSIRSMEQNMEQPVKNSSIYKLYSTGGFELIGASNNSQVGMMQLISSESVIDSLSLEELNSIIRSYNNLILENNLLKKLLEESIRQYLEGPDNTKETKIKINNKNS